MSHVNKVRLPRDCKEHHENGKTTTGVYEIYPYETVPSSISVLCDMETLNRGWTAIQKRVDGSVSFNKTWDEYKAGFGIPGEEDFWIGNELIYQLTKGNDSSLYVSITLVNGTTLYEVYERFSISNETEKYQLALSGIPTGTLGDKMQEWGAGGNFFSTWDRDHDRMGTSNCAGSYGGGWWFSACYYAFLNGQWASTDWFQPWFRIVHKGSDIMATKMMIKRF
ncbi:fibroleukin-like [Saccostrea cucullata]|uniref:fibroleukin-like n=1 Tax=Saccostrea cuccullata TaxID=36930 RepID=UPI002ED2607C